MAAQPMSPGGALLRSSRMFSLPSPLPMPAHSTATGNVNRSLTGTRPFPTYQAVTTPTSSRLRGDWGFKRSFPLKSTIRSSTPAIRVKGIDTIEQVSDFTSATDHSLTLEKFQDMNIPMVMPVRKEDALIAPRRSVFEEDGDVTVVDPADRARLMTKRWKFSGPWLFGLMEGEFQTYLKDQVRPRRAEFRQWLRPKIALAKNEDAAAAAQASGAEPPPTLSAEDITEQDIVEYLRESRKDRADMFKVVGEFLDLAPISRAKHVFEPGQTLRHQGPTNPYADSGPPMSHPSAGISYLRTGAFFENHPLYGPQKKRTHVEARVLVSRLAARHPTQKLGLGGFVVPQPRGDSMENQRGSASKLFNPDELGGKKLYVEPVAATVDSKGNIQLQVEAKDFYAESVAKELLGEKINFDAERYRTSSFSGRRRLPVVGERLGSRRFANSRADGNFGYGLGRSDGPRATP